MLALFAQNLALVLGLMTTLWVVSVFLGNVSIVDPWWSVGFLVVTANSVRATGLSPAKGVLLACVALWAIRLWTHLIVRARGKPEDPRYADFRQRFGPKRYWWVSFFQVFLLQGTLLSLLSLPLQIAGAAEPQGLTPLVVVGTAVFLAGFTTEVIADGQLQRFRNDPARRGGILDTGLWRYSRHPNYFGEALLQFGLWFFAAGEPHGLVSVLAPIGMTYMLIKVSGVAMLDALMARRKPAYREYMARTSGLLPWFPKS